MCGLDITVTKLMSSVKACTSWVSTLSKPVPWYCSSERVQGSVFYFFHVEVDPNGRYWWAHVTAMLFVSETLLSLKIGSVQIEVQQFANLFKNNNKNSYCWSHLDSSNSKQPGALTSHVVLKTSLMYPEVKYPVLPVSQNWRSLLSSHTQFNPHWITMTWLTENPHRHLLKWQIQTVFDTHF